MLITVSTPAGVFVDTIDMSSIIREQLEAHVDTACCYQFRTSQQEKSFGMAGDVYVG